MIEVYRRWRVVDFARLARSSTSPTVRFTPPACGRIRRKAGEGGVVRRRVVVGLTPIALTLALSRKRERGWIASGLGSVILFGGKHERCDGTPSLRRKQVIRPTRRRVIHDFHADTFLEQRNERFAWRKHLPLTGAEQDDFRLQRRNAIGGGDIEFRRIRHRPLLDDLIGSEHEAAREFAIDDRHRMRGARTHEQVTFGSILSELHRSIDYFRGNSIFGSFGLRR
jgi:hypothetical protein